MNRQGEEREQREQPERTGLAVDDSELAEAVEKRLRADPGLKKYGIAVTGHEGTVILQGVVDVMADRERARKLAERVAGVKKVEEALTVSTDGQITDADVQLEAVQELEGDPRVDTRLIGTEVEKGIVHLKGRAPHAGMVRAAMEAAARARGVRDVVSHVILDDGTPSDDASLVNRVEQALSTQRGRLVDPANLDVSARDGIVRLAGWVKDVAGYELAVQLASNVQGVVRVDGSDIRVGGDPPNPPCPTRGPARGEASEED